MPLEVDLEVTLCGEAVATYVALERPLTGVGAQVNLKSAVTAKDLGTEPALVFEEGVVGAGLGVKHRHVGRLALTMLHQSRERVECVSCGCDAGERIGEYNAA